MIAKDYRQRILIVDDQPVEIRSLIDSLGRGDSRRKATNAYEVKHVKSPEEAITFLQKHLCDLLLIDVNLDPSDPHDESGISLAQKVAVVAPDSAIIFLSRPSGVNQAQTVLQMLNLDVQGLTDRGRLAEAFVRKGNQDIKKYISRVLNDQHSGLLAVIKADPETWTFIESELEARIQSELGMQLIEGERQVLRLLVEVARNNFMTLSEIQVHPVGRGRSRTIVLHMTARYSTGHEANAIVKIGRKETVQMELRAYSKEISGFVRLNSYPHMAGFGQSRQLAGIGYTFLQGDRAQSPSFGDRFWTLDESASMGILSEVLDGALTPTLSPKWHSNRDLWTVYAERYLSLTNPAQAIRRENIARKLGPIQNSQWNVCIGGESLSLPNPTVTVDSSRLFYWPFCTAAVHGDLHVDNIIALQPSAQPDALHSKLHAFLIDFAHTGEQHVFMDYTVMEISVRSHLLRALFTQEIGTLHLLKKQWEELELELHRVALERGFDAGLTVGSKNPDGRLSRLARMILWLRRSAKLRYFMEPTRNYFASLHMTSQAVLAVPGGESDQDKVAWQAVRSIMTHFAGLSKEAAQQMKDEADSEVCLDLLSCVERQTEQGPALNASNRRTSWKLNNPSQLDGMFGMIFEATQIRLYHSVQGEMSRAGYFVSHERPEDYASVVNAISQVHDALNAHYPKLFLKALKTAEGLVVKGWPAEMANKWAACLLCERLFTELTILRQSVSKARRPILAAILDAVAAYSIPIDKIRRSATDSKIA